MKHEQAMNDSKNKTDNLAVCPACQPVREPRRRASLAFACLVCRPLRCGDLGAISALIDQSEPSCMSAVQTLYAALPAAQAVGGIRPRSKISANCVPVTP
jgi:hypothetical protein